MLADETTYAKLFLKVVLVSGGISPSPRHRLYGSLSSYAFTFVIVFVLLGDVIGILNESNLHLRIVTLLHMIGFSMGLVLYWCIRLNGHTLLHFIEEYFQPHYLDPQVIRYTEKRFRKMSIILTTGYWIFHLNFVGATFVHGIVGGIQDPRAYFLPTFYKCSAETRHDTYWISSFCWNVDTMGKYLIVNSFVSMVYLMLLIPYGSTFLFYFFAIIYINVNLEVFKRKVDALLKVLHNVPEKRRTSSSQRGGMLVSTMNSTDTSLCGEMSEIVLYYRKLRQALTHISPLLSYLASCYLVIFAMMVGTLLIVLLRVPTNGGYALFMVEYGMHVMIFFLYFALSCIGGETLRNMNTELAYTIYNLPWYDQSVQFQKLIYSFLILLTMKPLRVTAFQMTVQLRICKVFLQRMYSVMNLILTQI